MSSAKLTVMGLYNYDPTLFSDLTFPEGINKDIAVDEIVMRSGEFEVLYADPIFLKMAITHWGKKHYRTFEKWIDALQIEFEPLYNYDRYEEYTDTKNSVGASDYTMKDSRKNNSSSIETEQNENEGSTHDKDTHSELSNEQRSNIFDESVNASGNKSNTDIEQNGTAAHDLNNSNIGINESSGGSNSKIINGVESEESGESEVTNSVDNKVTTDNSKQNQTSLSQTDTNTQNDQTNTRSVSAYDAATYQPRDQEITSGGNDVVGNGLAVNQTTDEKNESEAENSITAGDKSGKTNKVSLNNEAEERGEHKESNESTLENRAHDESSNTVRTGAEANDSKELRDHDENINAINQIAGEGSKDSQTADRSNNLRQTSNIDETSGSADSTTKNNQVDHSTHRAHLYGNIGVTTSTQMLEDYIRVERFNIYEQIADIFTDEFCIKVY